MHANTMLELACANGDLEKVKQILNPRFIDKWIQWFFYQSPRLNSFYYDYAVRLACQNGHLEVVQYMMRFKQVRDISDGFTFACTHGQVEVAQWLLDILPILRYMTKKYKQNLFLDVCTNGQVEIARFLMEEFKDDLISSDECIKTSLRIAALHGHSHVVEQILQWRPDLKMQNF